MDISPYLHDVGAAAAGGIGSFLAFIRSISTRIKSLETETILKKDIEEWRKTVIQGLRLDWEQFKSELKDKAERISQSEILSIESLTARVVAIEFSQKQVFQMLLDKRFVTQEEVNTILRDQTKQWNDINRILGNIQGQLQR